MMDMRISDDGQYPLWLSRFVPSPLHPPGLEVGRSVRVTTADRGPGHGEPIVGEMVVDVSIHSFEFLSNPI